MDWFDWSGGDCPVTAETLVEIKCANGLHTIGEGAPAYMFIWEHMEDEPLNIVAFRLHEPLAFTLN